MDTVTIIMLSCLGFLVLFLLFQLQLKFWGKLFGVEYFEEPYFFEMERSGASIKDLFLKFERLPSGDYGRDIRFEIRSKIFYSLSDDEKNSWSNWKPFEGKIVNTKIDENNIRYRRAWVMNIVDDFGLQFTIYHGDTDEFYEDEVYAAVRFTSSEVIKFPWNRELIQRKKQFLKSFLRSFKEVEIEN